MTGHNIARPKYYRPEPGDEFVKLRDIGPNDQGRIFEARNQRNGEGVLGYLEDVNHYQLQGIVGLRFKGQPLGMFDVPDAVILRKSAEFRMPENPTENDA